MRCLRHEGGDLVKEMRAFIRGSREILISFCLVQTQQEVYDPEEGPSSYHDNLDLRLPASQTVGNQFLSFISHPEWCFVTVARTE